MNKEVNYFIRISHKQFYIGVGYQIKLIESILIYNLYVLTQVLTKACLGIGANGKPDRCHFLLFTVSHWQQI